MTAAAAKGKAVLLQKRSLLHCYSIMVGFPSGLVRVCAFSFPLPFQNFQSLNTTLMHCNRDTSRQKRRGMGLTRPTDWLAWDERGELVTSIEVFVRPHPPPLSPSLTHTGGLNRIVSLSTQAAELIQREMKGTDRQAHTHSSERGICAFPPTKEHTIREKRELHQKRGSAPFLFHPIHQYLTFQSSSITGTQAPLFFPMQFFVNDRMWVCVWERLCMSVCRSVSLVEEKVITAAFALLPLILLHAAHWRSVRSSSTTRWTPFHE